MRHLREPQRRLLHSQLLQLREQKKKLIEQRNYYEHNKFVDDRNKLKNDIQQFQREDGP